MNYGSAVFSDGSCFVIIKYSIISTEKMRKYIRYRKHMRGTKHTYCDSYFRWVAVKNARAYKNARGDKNARAYKNARGDKTARVHKNARK